MDDKREAGLWRLSTGSLLRRNVGLLKAAGLASQDLRAHPPPLFCDHAALRQHIEDEQTITRK